MAYASIPQSDKSIDWRLSAPEGYSTTMFTKTNIEKYFPTNLTPTTNSYAFGMELQSKMGQRIADDLLNGDFFKKSQTAKMVTSFQKMADKSVSFGNPGPGQVVHTFRFQVRAVERYAEMEYSGYFNSSVTYSPDTNTARIGLTKPLDQDVTLSFTDVTNIGAMDFNPNISLTYKF